MNRVAPIVRRPHCFFCHRPLEPDDERVYVQHASDLRTRRTKTATHKDSAWTIRATQYKRAAHVDCATKAGMDVGPDEPECLLDPRGK